MSKYIDKNLSDNFLWCTLGSLIRVPPFSRLFRLKLDYFLHVPLKNKFLKRIQKYLPFGVPIPDFKNFKYLPEK